MVVQILNQSKTMYSFETKSQLARLLANENLKVEHTAINTAAFDLTTRTLYVPIWKEMTGELYDLLMGHEVGHALETPPEGWHKALSQGFKDVTEPLIKKNSKYKNFLNVIEDARIEKKIKRRYPGIRKSFVTAYRSLFDRGFFGVKLEEVNGLFFIDRVNLYTKSGSTLPVKFTDQEQVLVAKVEACETWEDVLRVTDEIYEYSKEEQKDKKQKENKREGITRKDEGEVFASDEDEDEEPEESVKSKQTTEFGDSDETDEDDEEADHAINREKEGSPYSEDEQPECMTDEEYRKHEGELLDEKSLEYTYATIPTPNLKNIITPAKRVNDQIMEHHKNHFSHSVSPSQLLKDFKNKNDRYISLLAKEFEMRKAAKSYSKSKFSDTGDIDINKLSRYKLDDEIFRKVMMTPKGKSHGLVMLLDKSGSMDSNMAGSLEQIMVLVSFCRKVNIPFVAYGFGDNEQVKYGDSGYLPKEQPCFSNNHDELDFRCVYLREMINSNMVASDFTEAMKCMALLMDAYSDPKNRYRRPGSELLSNTPLNGALVAVRPIIENFKRKNNIDIVNLILIHDGDSDYCNRKIHVNQNTEEEFYNRKPIPVAFPKNTITIIRDEKTKLSYTLDSYDKRSMTIEIMNLLKDSMGVSIIGFYIASGKVATLRNAIYEYYTDAKGVALKKLRSGNRGVDYSAEYEGKQRASELIGTLRRNKFLESYTPGYNTFYIVPGGTALQVEDLEIEISGKVTSSKLAAAFTKMSMKKQINRVLVSKFIQQISVHESRK